LGIEVGLWFNPSVQHNFADWEKDAALLTGLWQRYGIRVFKIDGLSIPTKQAETNLRRLFDRVLQDTNGEALFNLDVTAGRRGGYFMLNEYGNLFLENRYTDWQNYYPYQTLRNLWMLARYVPAEKLQIEFLNNRRNVDKYVDKFAPSRYTFDYLFATTMAGQPLAWMEASNLDEDMFSTGDLIRRYRKLQADFHCGTILPIGDEPSGSAWTGFQSVTTPRSGYLLIYREAHPQSETDLTTWLPDGCRIRCTPLLGAGEKFSATVGEKGRLHLSLPNPNSFALYHYTIL
jgi:hypothetical protein